MQGSTILLTSSALLACEASSDAGLPTSHGSATALSISHTSEMTGTSSVSPGSDLAVLTTWVDGGIVQVAATSGSVDVTVDVPVIGGGDEGSYDLTFGSDVERGTFVAPSCNACLTPP